MKKIFLIILFNILFFTALVVITGYYIDNNICKDVLPYWLNNKIIRWNIDESKIDIEKYAFEINPIIHLESNSENFNKFCGEERLKFGEEYSKNPILVLGCSYAYGQGLKLEQTFPYLLANITKRPIYNFSQCGSHILANLQELENYSGAEKGEKINNAEYVIYVYMHDHINRYLRVDDLYVNYKYLDDFQQNKFLNYFMKIQLFRLLYYSFKINNIINGGGRDNIEMFIENSSQYLKKIMLSSYKKIKEIAPKAKFIIIIYDEKMPDENGNLKIKYDSEVLNSHIWQEINNETDIEVIHTKDITGFVFDKDYKLKKDISDWHPNEKAWAVFTPKFAKKYIN